MYQDPTEGGMTSETPATQQGLTEGGQGDGALDLEALEPEFPHDKLASLDEMISRPRWVVPVLPKGELEILLDAAIDLCRKGTACTEEYYSEFV